MLGRNIFPNNKKSLNLIIIKWEFCTINLWKKGLAVYKWIRIKTNIDKLEYYLRIRSNISSVNCKIKLFFIKNLQFLIKIFNKIIHSFTLFLTFFIIIRPLKIIIQFHYMCILCITYNIKVFVYIIKNQNSSWPKEPFAYLISMEP